MVSQMTILQCILIQGGAIGTIEFLLPILHGLVVEEMKILFSTWFMGVTYVILFLDFLRRIRRIHAKAYWTRRSNLLEDLNFGRNFVCHSFIIEVTLSRSGQEEL